MSPQKLLSENFEAEGRYENKDNAAMTTWIVSLNQISTKDKLAAEYLKFMSFMSKKDIPRDIPHAAYDDEASDVGGDQKDETDWPSSEVDDGQVKKSIGTWQPTLSLRRLQPWISKMLLGNEQFDTLKAMRNLALALDVQRKHDYATEAGVEGESAEKGASPHAYKHEHPCACTRWA